MTPAEPTSLLRREAEERAELITVRSTTVLLDLTLPGDHFASTTTISFGARTPGASTFLDFAGVELHGATLNGVDLDVASWSGRRIPLTDLQTENTVVVSGTMAYSSDGEGLHRHVDPADGNTYLYAMSFLDAGPRWFASFDQPDLKSVHTFQVNAPGDWVVSGNGPAERLADGSWRVHQPHPISTYTVTLVAGPYASVEAEHDGIRMVLLAAASRGDSLRAEAADLFEVTAQSFDYYHRVFGVRYPFGEYHQAFVPDFNAGAMENPGCVTFRDSFIYRGRATEAERATRAGVVAHEMAHQWFGDLVTMRWWDDLWLNESFAEYMAHRCCGEVTRYDLWAEYGIARKDWGYVADQAPSTHPVAGNGSVDAASALADFDGISYAKGASVLRQLAGLVGDRVFFDGLRLYFDAHAYGNAAAADLMAAWTAAGATGLDTWSEAWLRRAGVDTLTSRVSGGDVTVVRTPSARHAADRTHAVTVGAIGADGTELGRQPVTVATSSDPWPVPAGTRLLVPDVDDESWAKLRYAGGFADALAVLPEIAASATRVAVANSLRDGVRDAELDPAAALDAILALLASEPDEVVVSRLFLFAQDSLAERYAPVPARAGRRAAVHATATAIMAAAPAGSDRQLTAFRAAVRSADDADLLRSWSGRQGPPAGVELDAELRWSLVTRLAALTGDADVVEAAVAADPSGSGRVHACRARAALPDAEAKATAWEQLMRPSELSAYEVYALGEGFFQPAQTELTAPYVARYFAEIGGTAAFRTGWVLREAASQAFPDSQVGEETLARADALLADPGLPAPVRRSVTDRTDALRRAVASLRAFGD